LYTFAVMRSILTIQSMLFVLALFSCGDKQKVDSSPKTQKESTPTGLPSLPQNMKFCGQDLLLKDEDIRERLDREVLTNAYFQSATVQILKRAERFFPEIEKILKENGIPDDFKYLAVIESSLQQAVSPAGAVGFWQFMPETAAEYNLIINDEVDERMNITKSTQAACEYLKKAYAEFNDWLLAAASYNRGMGGVLSDLRWQGATHYFDTHMNPETARYVYRILAMKLIMENPEAYGFFIEKEALYKPFQTKVVTPEQSISNLSEWALSKGINYKILLKLNPWILGNKLSIGTQAFSLLLPADGYNLKPYDAYR
jgi:membrane-bound lytic murein transglycosylase D